MKKIYLSLIMLLIAGYGFSQYLTKTDARDQRVSKPGLSELQTTLNTPSSGIKSMIFEEYFEWDAMPENGWLAIDNNGDGNNWFVYEAAGASVSGTKCVASASWNAGVAITPDNWLISPSITIPETGTVMLSVYVGAQDPAWPEEKFKIGISTTGTSVGDFTDVIHTETLADGEWHERVFNLSAYAGEDIHVAIVHFDCNDNFYFKVDNFTVYQSEATDAAITAITSPNHDGECTLGDTEDVTVRIQNNSGSDISDFEVSYSINGGDIVTETVTVSISPAEHHDYTFTQAADLSALDYYVIDAHVNLEGDENPDNDEYSLNITSGDAKITINALTDEFGGQSWEVIDKLLGEVIAERTAAWQWNVEVTNEICVIDARCYDAIVYAEDGMESPAWLQILYNDVQVAGSTDPGSFTGPSLAAENLGQGCASTDAELAEIHMIFPSCEMGMVDIIVDVKNSGIDNFESFDVSYTINGGDPVVESVTQTIEPSEIYTHTFATQADLSSPGTYEIVATVILTGDENPDNNSAELTTSHIPPTDIPYTSGFDSNEELMGWAIENTNMDNSTWTLAEGFGVDDSNAMAYVYHETNDADDWIFSTCLDLIGGQTYEVSIDYSVMSSLFTEKLAVYYGAEQNSDAMSLIDDLGELTNEDWETGVFSFTPDTDGIYYIGFHCYSDADQYYLFIDNFGIDVAVNIANDAAQNISIYPNPSNGLVNITVETYSVVRILDVTGRLIENHNVNANGTVSFTHSPGMYVVQVESDGQTSNHKIIIQ